MHQARPFRPFSLELADDQRIRVPRPEFMAFLRSGRTVFVATGGESYKIIDLLLVASIDVSNGRTWTGQRNT